MQSATSVKLIKIAPTNHVIKPSLLSDWITPHDFIQKEPRDNIILKSQVSFGQGELLIKENLAQKQPQKSNKKLNKKAHPDAESLSNNTKCKGVLSTPLGSVENTSI